MIRGVGTSMVQKLGKYTIVEKLGEGAMGAVYKAYDAVLDRYVAIKTMAEEIRWDPELKLRFYREARAAANLHHPNIVTIHDLGEEGKTTYIVMELLEGIDLKSVIADRISLTLERKLTIVSQIADGLNHAHKQGIVHRDIKPGNIHVSASGNVRILDFGIARIPSSDLTRIGARLGTPVYMSPEQIRGESYDERSDMFSTGMVFYELITYVHPFRDKKIAKTLDNILYQEQFPFDEQFPDAPPGLWPIISTCLAKEPNKRYATMADLARACRALFTDLALARKKMATEVESAMHLLRQGVAATGSKDRLLRILQEAQPLLDMEHEPDYVALLKVSKALAAETSRQGSMPHSKSIPQGAESSTRSDASGRAPVPETPLPGVREPVPASELQLGAPSPAPVTDSPASRTAGIPPDAALPPTGRALSSSVPREEIERRGKEMVQAAEQMLRDDRFDEALDQLRAAIGILGPKDDLVRMLADTRKRNEEKRRARLAALLDAAKAAVASGQNEKAIEVADKILELEPEKAEALDIRRQASAQLDAERAHQAKREEAERGKALGYQLLAERNYQESLRVLRRAAEILPDDPAVKLGIESAEGGLLAEELRMRVQAELAEALQLFRAQAFDQARVHANRVLELSPQNGEASELLARIENGQAEQRKQESIATLLRQTRESLMRGAFDVAMSTANQIRTLDSSNPHIEPLLDQILAGKENVRRSEEVAALLAKADDAMSCGDLNEAEYQAMQALAVIREHPGALERLKKINQAKEERARAQEIENLVANAKQALRNSNPEQSESLARQILELDPQNSEARDLLNLAAQMREQKKADRIRELLGQANAALNAGEVLRASNYARDVLTLDVKNADALKLLSHLEEAQKKRRAEEIAGLLSHGREALSLQRFQEAAELAHRAMAQDPKSSEAKALLKEIDKTSRALEREKKKSEEKRVEEKAVSPAAQDATVVMGETVLLRRPGRRRQVLVAVLAAIAVVALGVVLGARYLSRHGETTPGPAARLAEARARLEKRQYDQAIGILKGILASSPGDSQAEALLSEVEKHKRQATIDAYLKEAGDLRAQNQLEESNRALQKVLDIDPTCQPALALRSEIEAQISSGKRKGEEDQEIQKAADSADSLLAAGKLPEARSEIDKIERLRPEAPQLSYLRKRLAAKAVQLERKKEEQAEMSNRLKRISDLSVKASDLFRQGKYAEAQGVLERWQAEAPEDNQAQNLHNQGSEALRNLRIYESAFAAKQYDAALQALSRLERINPADPSIGDMRKRAESSKAAAKATFSVYRLGEPGVLMLDNQRIGTKGEVEGEVVKAGSHKLAVMLPGGKESSLLLEFFDGQNRDFVYESATSELREFTGADKDALARRKQREEVRQYPAEHLHGLLRGKCTGYLLISGVRVEYKPAEGDHSFSIPFKNLKLTVKEDKVEFLEAPGGRLLQLKVQDARQAGYIRKQFNDLEKLGK